MFSSTVPPCNPAQVQAGRLPDDSDRASSVVGYDINKYVFGDENGNLPSDNPCCNSPSGAGKGKSTALGALALGALILTGAICYRKGQGKPIPKFKDITKAIGDFFKKFKKPATP